MLRSAIFVGYVVIVVFEYQTHAERIRLDDLNVAASKKEESWENGDESNYHQSDFSGTSENSKKGYDSKRGCIFIINLTAIFAFFFYSLFMRLIKNWVFFCSGEKGKKGHHNKKHEENEHEEKKGHKKSHNNDSG